MDVIIEFLNYSTNDGILHITHSCQPLDYYIPLIDHTFSRKWIFIGDETYRNGVLHSFDDLPARIYPSGTQYWYQHGNRHRDNDLPATIWSDGTQEWWKNGKLHRDNDLPARIYPSGTQYWYQHGNRHRDNDLPAVLHDGREEYYKNDKQYYP